MNILALFAVIAIAIVLIWGLTELLKIFPNVLPQPIARALYILIVVLVSLWAINEISGFAPGYRVVYHSNQIN